ncbi:DUF1990 family protein [Actinospica robiniae]|uniref:DUF1990 domain-containing protein n=1 Tax=Actinospica robiniae DSM 44927 TaxID=479430 RepID=W9DZP5_9ACTN|nr:DUF1990 domain-containing protein [Actinospica robiniae]ETA71065.1 hypothetical protein ActroDRAFT_0086 [Actinospica robiniae DSM 44927]
MAEFSYPEVGATRDGGPLPAGYKHVKYRAQVGRGRDAFEQASSMVLEWRMHAALHLRPRPERPRAEPGSRVQLALGPIRAQCAVVWALDEPRRRGFAYGTLPGHPECGEEAFLIEWDDHDDVWLTITVFSTGAAWYTRAIGPLVPWFQRLYAVCCAAVVRRAANSAGSAGGAGEHCATGARAEHDGA